MPVPALIHRTYQDTERSSEIVVYSFGDSSKVVYDVKMQLVGREGITFYFSKYSKQFNGCISAQVDLHLSVLPEFHNPQSRCTPIRIPSVIYCDIEHIHPNVKERCQVKGPRSLWTIGGGICRKVVREQIWRARFVQDFDSQYIVHDQWLCSTGRT